MVQSGNLFLPTINGEVYFDKPLLSYWAIIPFYLVFGMTEAAARLPSGIAAIALVALVFAMGRDLFGERTGIISAALFLTSAMIVFWSRTASAEMLNLLAIWSMLWVFLRGARGGHFLHLLIFFCIGAAASFCKGPVAFAVAFAVVAAYSAVNVLFSFRGQALSWRFAKEQALNEYKWILSWQGFAAAAAAALLFVMFLLLPVFFTGSWDSVLLMWKENVIRFVKPFDHVEPPYAYLVHSLVFSSPWTLVVLVSLWDIIVRCENDWKKRWLVVVTVTIFLFFTVSGSRRSYYILPIVPALVLIAGKSLSDWFESEENIRRIIMKLAVIVTAVIPILVGAAMIYVYLKLEDFKHISEVALGPLALAGGITAIWFVLKNRAKRGFIFLFLLFFVLELWGFTIGMGMAEKKRTLKPFCLKANEMLKGVDDDIIALYGVTNSSLIYYFKRDRALHNLKDPYEVDTFSEEHREFFLIAEATLVPSIQGIYTEGEALAVLEQEPEGKRDRENSFVLIKIVQQSKRDIDEDEDNEGEEKDNKTVNQ